MNFHSIIKQLNSLDETERLAAREALFLLDEDAVTPLIDQFYAGLHEADGLAVLEILNEIGGYEVLQLMEALYHIEARYESWRQVAAQTLQREGRL